MAYISEGAGPESPGKTWPVISDMLVLDEESDLLFDDHLQIISLDFFTPSQKFTATFLTHMLMLALTMRRA